MFDYLPKWAVEFICEYYRKIFWREIIEILKREVFCLVQENQKKLKYCFRMDGLDSHLLDESWMDWDFLILF